MKVLPDRLHLNSNTWQGFIQNPSGEKHIMCIILFSNAGNKLAANEADMSLQLTNKMKYIK